MKEKESVNYVFVICVILSFLLLLFPVSGVVHSVRVAVSYSLYPSLYYGEKASHYLGNVPQNVLNLIRTDQENVKLKEQIKDLQLQLQSYSAISAEVVRLREEMKLSKSIKWTGIWARVIGKDVNNWYGFATINKGSDDNIKLNDSVLSMQNGNAVLIGRIYEVFPKFSKIILLGNVTSSVISSLGNDGIDVLVDGTGSKTLKINYIPEDMVLTEGTDVYSSHSSTLYLPNIKIGTISKVYKRESFISFVSADITPSVDISQIKEVYVINRKLPDELIPESDVK